jgi:hypothetical protein
MLKMTARCTPDRRKEQKGEEVNEFFYAKGKIKFIFKTDLSVRHWQFETDRSCSQVILSAPFS